MSFTNYAPIAVDHSRVVARKFDEFGIVGIAPPTTSIGYE